MPFLALPRDDELLRFQDDQITFHYLVSTPTNPTFRYAETHASLLASSLLPNSPTRSKSNVSEGNTTKQAGVELDPNYPIILFLPSECFSVAHLFSSQLADPVLSANFNLVAIDPRGHGLTRDVPIKEGSGRKYDLDIKAADILDFTHLLLKGKTWSKGIHILACSMSGLVAARMAASWPGSFESIMITSPILEVESQFMVESFQGIKELLEESWQSVHSPTIAGTTEPPALERRTSDFSSSGSGKDPVKLPGEVVQGFTFRWAGSEKIPHHISSYLSRTWLERLVLHKKGLEAARDWWFDLYWLRKPMSAASLDSITSRILIVEGDSDLPYDRNVGEEIGALFPNAKGGVKVKKVERAPFLLSVKRPKELTEVICSFLGVGEEEELVEETPTHEKQDRKLGMGAKMKEVMLGLEPEERFELVKVYAPDLVADSDDEDEEQETASESESGDDEEESNTEPEDHPLQYRLRYNSVPNTKLGSGEDGGMGFTATRTTRTVSTSSIKTGGAVNNHSPTPVSEQRSPALEGGEHMAPLVQTLHETHI